MIHVENLSFKYPGGNNILNCLNFDIAKGEFVAIIGQNGAGKTTLLKQLNGLLKPSEGKVLVNGLDVSRTSTSELAGHIGFLFQNPDHQIFCSTVYEEIAFGLKNTGRSAEEIDDLVRKAAERVGLHDSLSLEPFTLSKGQRQRVALASVLAMETEVLVLDEPTTGQDYREGVEIMELVADQNRQGKTIIMVTHDMELVAGYAGRVIILNSGTVIDDGPVHKVLCNTENLAASYLDSPQIYLLARKFVRQGIFKSTLSAEEMFDEILKLIECSGGARYVGNG